MRNIKATGLYSFSDSLQSHGLSVQRSEKSCNVNRALASLNFISVASELSRLLDKETVIRSSHKRRLALLQPSVISTETSSSKESISLFFVSPGVWCSDVLNGKTKFSPNSKQHVNMRKAACLLSLHWKLSHLGASNWFYQPLYRPLRWAGATRHCPLFSSQQGLHPPFLNVTNCCGNTSVRIACQVKNIPARRVLMTWCQIDFSEMKRNDS